MNDKWLAVLIFWHRWRGHVWYARRRAASHGAGLVRVLGGGERGWRTWLIRLGMRERLSGTMEDYHAEQERAAIRAMQMREQVRMQAEWPKRDIP